MSSLRNAVKRITHKERSQPQSRSHLGILEKKGDFLQRAKHYHAKMNKMKVLREKASNRNPDEFYFGMQKSKVKDGKHVQTTEARNLELEHFIGGDAVRIMKDQDLSYIRMQIQKDQSQIEQLEARLHLFGANQETDGDHANNMEDDQHDEDVGKNSKLKRNHKIYVKNLTQVQSFDIATHFDTVPELANREFNRPKKSTLIQNATLRHDKGSLDLSSLTDKQRRKQLKQRKSTAKSIARARILAYQELEARKKRKEALQEAEAHLITEKLTQSKGRKRKIKAAGDGKPAVYKWRRKRAK